MAPHTMKPEVGLVCFGPYDQGQMSKSMPIPIHVYIHHLHTDRSYSLHWKQSTIPLSSRFFHNIRVAVLGGVNGRLTRYTRDLSSAASRWFPMVLGDTAGATCARISSLDVIWAATAARTMCQSWWASILHGYPEPGLREWQCSSNHCCKQLHTTDTLCPTRAAINPASLRPTMRSHSNGWSCSTGVQIRRRGMVAP